MAKVRKEKILVVDDEENIRKSLKMILEYEGYKFLEAADGEEALDIVEEIVGLDLILLDVKLPGRDGLGQHLDAACVHDDEGNTVPLGHGVQAVAGGARLVVHNRDPLADDTIEKRGFSHVGTAHESHDRVTHWNTLVVVEE